MEGRSSRAGPYVVTSWLWQNDETVVRTPLILILPSGLLNKRGSRATFGSTSRIDHGALNCCCACDKFTSFGSSISCSSFRDVDSLSVV